MKGLDDSSIFYNEAICCIDQNDYKGAVNSIKKDIDTLRDKDDLALAYLNCGFLNDKLGDYISAIDDFTKSIYFEEKIDIIPQISKDISLNGRINGCGAIKPRFSVKLRDMERHEARYLPAKDFGLLILTTPYGVMNNDQAKEASTGGKLLAYVY